MNSLYVDYAGGHFEAWTYSEGRRIFLPTLRTMPAIRAYAKRYGYRLVLTEEAKLFC